MSWIQTYIGRKIDPLNMSAKDVDIRDIAHALSMTCRFNGHVSEFYSVAQHSVLVADELRKRGHGLDIQLQGLLHDAAEAYLTDVPAPIKGALVVQEGRGVGSRLHSFKDVEDRIMEAVVEAFGLGWPFHPEIKEVDTRIRLDEGIALMGGKDRVRQWGLWNETEPLGMEIEPWEPGEAKRKFVLCALEDARAELERLVGEE